MGSRPTSGTKRDQIVDHLRRLIVSGEIARGERLRQDALAEQFGTSITPVREALSILASDGLVVAEPHRGVRVADVDLERVTSAYILRRLSETYAVERATVRLSALDLLAVGKLATELEEAAESGDYAAVRRLNRMFHFSLYERCGIAGLTEHIASLWSTFPWDLMLSSQERVRASVREHREILEALRAGDPARAGAATARHIQKGFLAVTARLGGDGATDPFDVSTP